MEKKITKKLLKSLASDSSYSRGNEYYLDGQVKDITFENGGYSAIVWGADQYFVKISDLNDKLIFSCSCPYDWGGICKHCVATGLAVMNNDSQKPSNTGNDNSNKTDQEIEIKTLLKQASQKDKDEFLIRVLNEDSKRFDQFKLHVQGEEKLIFKQDIEAIRDTIIRRIEEIGTIDNYKLSEYEEEDNEYWVDDWESMSDAGLSYLYEILCLEIDKAEKLLHSGYSFEPFQVFLAVYEAIQMADYDQIIDDMELFGSVQEEFMDIWLDKFDSYKDQLKINNTNLNILFKIIKLLAKRIEINHADKIYEFYHFDDFLIDITDNKTSELISANILPFFQSEDTALLIMQIAKTNSDIDMWLKTALQGYQKSPIIANKLLGYYIGNGLEKEYLQTANIAFELWSGFLAEIMYDNLDYQQDPVLYLKIVHFLVRNKREKKYFLDYAKYTDKKQIDTLVEQLKLDYDKEFYIEILVELKRWNEIREFFDEHLSEEYDIIYFTKPIINIFPEHCFHKIRLHAEDYLKNNIGRKYYRTIAVELKLLLDIEDKAINQKFQTWVTELLLKYKKRPALKDEFSKAGLKK